MCVAHPRLANAVPSIRNLAGCLLVAVAFPHSSFGVGEPIEASLSIPPADTRVIGDGIQLFWHFKNTGPRPLAFLWEGCCRLNGRLAVTRAGATLDPIPPGAALAHQFAKAETLQPGEAATFETRLDAWVQLRQSGRYRLQGSYTGVLPSQTPMIPEGLELWRGTATTPPIEVEVLDPLDYLGQRETRRGQRPWHFTVTGPGQIPPVEEADFQVTFHSTSDQATEITWPGATELWIVNDQGERIGLQDLKTPLQTFTLPPRDAVTRTFSLDADVLFDASFGRYTVFLDRNHPQTVRCPSNPLTLAWELDPLQVSNLIRRAATGPSSGLRNKPLKRLRVHLAELGPKLMGLRPIDFDPDGAGLLRELQIASCLKPFSPTPGVVTLPLLMETNGLWHIAHPDLTSCLPVTPGSPGAPLNTILRLRRHLGWSVKVTLHPHPNTPLGSLRQGLQTLTPLETQLAGPVVSPLQAEETSGTTNLVTFQNDLIPANAILKLHTAPSGPQVRGLLHLPDPQAGPLASVLPPDQIRNSSFEPLPSPAALGDWLSDPRLQHPRLLVWADPGLTWGEMARTLLPLSRLGWPLDLVTAPVEN